MPPTPVPLPRSTPESQGVASASILAFVNAVEATGLELHSLMMLRHDHVIAEGWWAPYAAPNRHLLYSLSKSFTSTAAGFAIQEGYFSLDDPVIEFFPDEAPPEASPHLLEMRVRDLLTMTSGHEEDTLRPMLANPGGNWAGAFLALPVPRAPGTHFVYNSGATYMVAAIVQKTTGHTLLDWLEPRLFAPLGITDALWQSSPQGVNVGGWGLSLKTEDIARFGQFYGQKGTWNGQQLLNAAWIEAATSFQVPNANDNPTQADGDWAQGYGFQFWRCRHNAYRGDGAFGQFCVVMPDQDAVVAITGNVGPMHDVLDLVWLHLLPACAAAPQPADVAAHEALQTRLGHLAVPLPSGTSTSPLAAQMTGNTYHFAPNDLGLHSLALDFGEGACTFTIEDAGGMHRFTVGLGQWRSQDTDFLQHPVWLETPRRGVWRLTSQGVWTDAATFVVKLCFDETPFTPRLTCYFTPDGGLRLDFTGRIGFTSPEVLGLEGTLA